ncbi:MAG TPA: uroporphyrinogen decarboxylase family protein [bacterium]
MTSKQRVHAALKREPVDRIPIFMWFHPDTAIRLAKLLEIPPNFISEAMGDDVRQTWVGNNYAMEGIIHQNDGENHVDDWGIEWIKEGSFNQIKTYPLLNVTIEAILQYKFPHDRIEFLLENMKPVMAQDEKIFIGCDVSPCLFEMICRLRGMENAILDLVDNPELSNELLKRSADFAIKLSEKACGKFELDWLWTGDDVGGQLAMIMSPHCWRDMIRPHLEKIFYVGKSKGLWLAYHSCGAIRPIIPDLIEMGLDVLNPIQCNCPGMDPFELKNDFGKQLTFMGGVDTVDLLPNGTAADVRRKTAKLIEGMTADGGGFILAASHTVPPETPMENIFAMYDVAGISREEIFARAADIRKQMDKFQKANDK